MKKRPACATAFETSARETETHDSAMTRILLEEDNPYGNASAFVEDDGRTVYLYRTSPEGSVIAPAAVWVRNRIEAPELADDSPSQGIAPLMRRANCAHPQGLPSFSSDDMEMVWFPDGSGVSLYAGGELQAVLPPWAGRDAVHGYARDAVGFEAFTVPLPPEGSGLYERLDENRRFWQLREREGDWAEYRDLLLGWYESVLGPHSQYYAVDTRMPLLGIAQFDRAGESAFATVGMGRQPQPGIELHHEDPRSVVRTEILCRFTARTAEIASQVSLALGRMAAYPWRTGRFFDDGHVYETADADGPAAFLLTASAAAAAWEAALPEPPLLDGEYPLRILYAVPCSAQEASVARAKGVDFQLSRMAEKRSVR